MSQKKEPLVKFHLTERALADLIAIESYSIKQWGKGVAKKYLSHGNMDLRNRLAELLPRLATEIQLLHGKLRSKRK